MRNFPTSSSLRTFARLKIEDDDVVVSQHSMSQYISSFLIEPVVRQARRFSRPNNDSYIEQTGEEQENSNHAEIQIAADRSAQDDSSALIIETQGDGLTSTSSGNPEVAEALTTLNDTNLTERRLQQGEQGVSVHLRNEGLDNQLQTTAPRTQAAEEPEDTSIDFVFRAERSGSPESSSNSSRSLSEARFFSAEASSQSARLDGIGERTPEDSDGSRQLGDRVLPADDGMGEMRQRIIAIHRTDSPNEVKARLVHDLMVEKHNSSQQSLNISNPARAHSPTSFQSSETPFTPSSPKSIDSCRQQISPPTSSGSGGEAANRFQLTPEDLKPTYYVKSSATRKEADNERRSSDIDDEPQALGCAHYKRNIKLQCSQCHRWYTCRFCHDAVEDHILIRKETKNMLCMLCGHAQPACEVCIMCGERGAWYYCDVCKLWDDDPHKSIYHCNDCGICRVGQGLGKDFFHCKTCCVCMSISIRDTHRCIERSTDCDCPICGDYMFTSPQTVVFMRCGHSIHHRCYNEHMKSSYRCPICNRSIVNMEWQFSRLERAIEAQPMPEEFRDTKALVYCNDCCAKTSVQYHWLGLKCAVCDSYNTAQLQILSGPDPAGADYAEAPPTIPEGEALSTTAPRQITPPISRPHSPNRGRTRYQHHQLTQSRSGVSAPPSTISTALTRVITSPSRQIPSSRAHSATADNSTATNFPFSASSPYDESNGTGSSLEDADDSMDEYDEVDFWGGESPSSARQIATSPPLLFAWRGRNNEARSCEEQCDMTVDEHDDWEESEDGEDSGDEDEIMGMGVNEEEDEEDDEGRGDRIEFELIGHR